MNTTYELVRNGAALFDFSSEGRYFVSGPEAVEVVNSIIAKDLEAVPELKALNTVLLEPTGAVNAILWVFKAEDGIWLLCDEDRRSAVAASLRNVCSDRSVTLEDRTDSTFCFAINGPAAQNIAMSIAGDDVIGIPYLGFEPNEQTGTLVARLGYTGEFEYRFIADRNRAMEFQTQLMDIGSEWGLAKGEHEALPLLMLEMRSLLQRAHIVDGAGPIPVGLHWMVDFRKDEYVGREAVHEQKERPEYKALILVLDTNVPVENGPLRLESQSVGRSVYTSWSPTLEKTLAFAYVDPEFAWVGIVFDLAGHEAKAVSAPLFITKTVSNPD